MPYHLFKNAIIIQASGADTERYLNARLTNDIKKLADLQSCQAAALNAQGKTEAFVLVVRIDSENFLLACDGGDPEEILSALGRFIVADRVELKDISTDYSLLHITDLESSAKLTSELGAEDGSLVKLDNGFLTTRTRLESAGSDLLIKTESINESLSSLETEKLNDDKWNLARVSSGLPSFPDELNSKHLFSEAGLTSAISFTKGCYVGQEVMEKIDAFAKTPFILKRVSLGGKVELAKASQVNNEEGLKLGAIISYAYSEEDDKTFAFARLKNSENLDELNLFAIDDHPVLIS